MQDDAAVQQADEVYCPSCNAAIGKGLAVCPECGKAVPFEYQGMAGFEFRRYGQPMPAGQPISPAAGAVGEPDVVGVGRYVLNFLLAGFIGLGITYLLRNHGWLATFICIPILIIMTVIVFQTGAFSPEASP